MQPNTILWDWNGTLLNDIHQSVDAMNELLEKRNHPPLSIAKYKDIFCFPVIKYYEELNFNFQEEKWENVAAEFMNTYHEKEPTLTLHSDTISALNYFQNKGYKQYILSAMMTDSILTMLETFNITHYFDGVYGLDNHYANSKIYIGHKLLETEKLSARNCLLIGDTMHDAEVAEALKCNCTLISHGHQSHSRLENTNYPTFQNLKTLINTDH